VRLPGEMGNGFATETVLLADDEQSAEELLRLRRQAWCVAHDICALPGRQRPERHFMSQSAGCHGLPTLASLLGRPNPLVRALDYKVNTSGNRRYNN